MIKMYCVFAMESVKKMNGNRGKLASMAGHAYLHSWWDSDDRFTHLVGEDTDYYRAYNDGPARKYKRSNLAFKITLIVDTVDELVTLHDLYKPICGVSLVTDAARTVFAEPTTVCLGIGPIHENMVKEDLSSLKVFM